MSRFCPACHRSEALNPLALTADRTTCPRDFFELVNRDVVDPIQEIFGGKYQTELCIYASDQHSIFRVVEPANGQRFNVSVLDAKGANMSHIIRFVDAWSQIRHRNIMPVTTSGGSPDKKYLYVVSENSHGTALTTILDEQGALPADVAVQIFLQLCDGLEKVGAANIVHGNCMPAHVYKIENSDTPHHVMLSIDAALARFTANAPNLITSGVTDWSPLYLGLEFMTPGEAVDAFTEVYSLGCFMYGVLTGLPPFTAKTFADVRQLHATEQPLSLRGVAPDLEIPGLFDKLVLRTLRKSKDERYPDVSALKSDLLIATEKSRIYLPTYMNATYTAHAYTGDTGSYKTPPKPGDFIQGVPTSTQAPPTEANPTGPVDFGTEMAALTPETRQELEDKVQGLRSHVYLVTGLAIAVIVGLGAILTYEGPAEDHAPAWKKLSWTMAMSSGDGALAGKDYEKAKQAYGDALKTAEEIQDGGDRKVKTLRKLRTVHEGLRDKKGAEALRSEIIKFGQQRLKQDEAPVR